MKYIFTISVLLLMAACNPASKDGGGNDTDPSLKPVLSGIPAPKAVSYTILSEFPHDTASFTEGLEIYQGKLYESGGDYIHSRLQYGDFKTGVVEKKNMMGTDKIFGEGISILHNKLYQLTYQTNIVYVYDINNIQKPIKTFPWPQEGWGMTNNGTDLIITTKEPNLYFVDPETFKIKNTVAVIDDKGPVPEINELEYIDGFIWANVWMTNRILKIDPESGHVVGDMYLNNIASPEGRLLSTNYVNTDVMNGIAYDSLSKTFLITGKRWPKMYQLRIN